MPSNGDTRAHSPCVCSRIWAQRRKSCWCVVPDAGWHSVGPGPSEGWMCHAATPPYIISGVNSNWACHRAMSDGPVLRLAGTGDRRRWTVWPEPRINGCESPRPTCTHISQCIAYYTYFLPGVGRSYICANFVEHLPEVR